MERVYSVNINGRTLEGRNLKELLARAVSAKRNTDRGRMIKAPYAKISPEDVARVYVRPGDAVAH
jgi:hypothetical protein